MPTLTEIEKLTETYARHRASLKEAVGDLQAQIDAVKRSRLGIIRLFTNQAREARSQLQAALEASPELFKSPRTRTFHDVKVGYTKQRGKVVVLDPEATVRRIREQLPKDQAELLIRVTEEVHKPAVYDLTAADLRRLGIRIEDDEDVVVIKTTDKDVDKLVAALLDDGANAAEEAA